MNIIHKIKTLITVTVLLLFSAVSFAQQGHVTVNEDPELTKVIELKKEINKDEDNHDKYKIQIFSGTLSAAENAKTNFLNSVGKWSSQLVYETPNYKVWVGKFRSRLEADRALLEIQKKKEFTNAFIFKPKKKN